jgi:hypothetical protein
MKRRDASIWRGEFFGGESASCAMKHAGGTAPGPRPLAASNAGGRSCCAAIVHSLFDLTGLIGRWQLLLPVRFS